MTLKYYKFLILVLAFSSMMLINFQTVQGDDYSPRNVSIKGKLIQSHSLTGDIFWIILYEDKGTLVTTSENGVIVIRFDFIDHDKCYAKENTYCLKAILTETKNTRFTKVGDVTTIILEYPEKISFSVLSGELVTNTFELNIEKLRNITPN